MNFQRFKSLKISIQNYWYSKYRKLRSLIGVFKNREKSSKVATLCIHNVYTTVQDFYINPRKDEERTFLSNITNKMAI